MHGIVYEFNRVIFELRSAHLYPESELLLATRQMTSIDKDLWCGELVPSSHQRGKLSYTILDLHRQLRTISNLKGYSNL